LLHSNDLLVQGLRSTEAPKEREDTGKWVPMFADKDTVWSIRMVALKPIRENPECCNLIM